MTDKQLRKAFIVLHEEIMGLTQLFLTSENLTDEEIKKYRKTFDEHLIKVLSEK